MPPSRVESRNPVVNAVTMKLYDYGRQAIADACRGLFRGVPYLMKDLTSPIAGVRMTRGSTFFRHAFAAGQRARTAPEAHGAGDRQPHQHV